MINTTDYRNFPFKIAFPVFNPKAGAQMELVIRWLYA